MRIQRLARGREEGMTLVELMVVMTIMTIVGGVVIAGLLTGHRAVRAGEDRLDALGQLQHSLEVVAREVRAADAAPTVLSVAEPNRLRTEVTRNGVRYRYTYEVVGGNLLEVRENLTAGGAATTRTVARDVGNDPNATPPTPVFVYLDRDGAVTATLADIRSVRISLEREISERAPITVDTFVRLRNAGGL